MYVLVLGSIYDITTTQSPHIISTNICILHIKQYKIDIEPMSKIVEWVSGCLSIVLFFLVHMICSYVIILCTKEKSTVNVTTRKLFQRPNDKIDFF